MLSTARGNRARNRISSGLRRLLIRTTREIDRVIRLLISKRPK